MWYTVAALGGFAFGFFMHAVRAAFQGQQLTELIADNFGIKPPLDWSHERQNAFRRQSLVRLGMHHEVRKATQEVMVEVREKLEAQG